MVGHFFLFINYRQAARLGHVGWGFQVSENRYMYGSTDHLTRHEWWDLPAWLDYMNVEPSGDIDWWSDYGDRSEMLESMTHSAHHIWYHEYKDVEVLRADPKKAEATALALKDGGWSTFTNNCVLQTFQVARAYGANSTKVPNPSWNPLYLIPRVWFPATDGAVGVLREWK